MKNSRAALIALAVALLVALAAGPVAAQNTNATTPVTQTLLLACGAVPNANGNATVWNTYNYCVSRYQAERSYEISVYLGPRGVMAQRFQVLFWGFQVVCIALGLVAGLLASDF
jgi:hypothetical protein